MSGVDKTTKIQNDHADEKISVQGSSISSKSDANEDQFASREPVRQNDPAYDDTKQIAVEGAYEPAQYASLPISGQLKQLFKTIQRYSPILTDLDTKLKAFIPEYIPAIGQVDAFLKMPRPDGQPQTLGLYVLDEPALNQVNKAKMDLELQDRGRVYKKGGKYNKVHAIEEAEKKPKEILQWINSVAEIQRTKQPPSVSYSRAMPDIDSLMQVWPAEVEQLLADMAAPSEQIDLSLADYSRVACNILDIPIHPGQPNSIVESLHVLFTLYSAFKQNQHFQMGQQNQSYLEGHR